MQAFKRRFISPLDRLAPWTISATEIAAWLAVVEAEDRDEARPDGPRAALSAAPRASEPRRGPGAILARDDVQQWEGGS